MKRTIKKPEIPLLWLDTNLIILFTKMKEGRLSLEDAERIPELYEAINRAVISGKVICPSGSQVREFDGHRKWDEIEATLDSLSRGVKMQPPYGVARNQRFVSMKSFIDDAESVTFDYIDAFFGDPIEKATKALDEQIRVRVASKQDKVFTEIGKDNKEKTNTQLERIRLSNVKNKRTYHNQIELEYQSELRELNRKIRLLKNQRVTQNLQGNELRYLGDELAIWDHLGGKKPASEGLSEYYRSNTYRQMPYMDISCKLSAHIVTLQSRQVQKSDPMDIKFMASALPFYDYVFTDNDMKHQVKLLQLDKVYYCKVFSISDSEQVIKELNGLSNVSEN